MRKRIRWSANLAYIVGLITTDGNLSKDGRHIILVYRFMVEIGLTPNKTKTIGSLLIPDKYFADFLRGHLDGDGYTHSYWDPRWKNSFMLYLGFISASFQHLEWIQNQICELYKINGKISFHKSVFHLRFAKRNSVMLISKIYYKKPLIYLKRKQFKIHRALAIISGQAEVGKW